MNTIKKVICWKCGRKGRIKDFPDKTIIIHKQTKNTIIDYCILRLVGIHANH